MRSLTACAVVILAPLATACAAPTYRLNIPRRADAATMVLAASVVAERDRPPETMDRGARLDALALMEIAGASMEGLAPSLLQESAGRRAALADRIRRETIAVTWPTTHAGAFAVHEVTVGTIDLPFAEFLARFSPAADWGKNLSGHLGGELGGWQSELLHTWLRPRSPRRARTARRRTSPRRARARSRGPRRAGRPRRCAPRSRLHRAARTPPRRPGVVKKILEHLGLPTDPLPRARARDPMGQQSFDFDAA